MKSHKNPMISYSYPRLGFLDLGQDENISASSFIGSMTAEHAFVSSLLQRMLELTLVLQIGTKLRVNTPTRGTWQLFISSIFAGNSPSWQTSSF